MRTSTQDALTPNNILGRQRYENPSHVDEWHRRESADLDLRIEFLGKANDHWQHRNCLIDQARFSVLAHKKKAGLVVRPAMLKLLRTLIVNAVMHNIQ